MFIGALPFLLGQAMTPPGAMFYGNKYIAPADFSIYYSYIHQGAQAHLFMYDAFTSEAAALTIFQPLWFLVGLGAHVFHLNPPTAFAAARLIATPVLLVTLWWATGWIWREDKRRRRIGFVLSIVASGLGGILTVIGPQFTRAFATYPDVWVSEGFILLTLWSSAHFILATSGIIFVLVAVERSWLEQRSSWACWAGLVALATLSIHPFHIITWTILWVELTVWRWVASKSFPLGYVKHWLLVLVMASPVLLLYGLQLLFDPLTIGRAIQNINLTPVPWVVAVGLGLPLLGALVSKWTWRLKDGRWQWLVSLAVAYCIVVYIPFTFQRRLMQGMIIPFIFLSVPLFEFLIFSNRRRLIKVFSGTALALALSSSWFFVGGRTVQAYANDLRQPTHLYFLPAEYLAAAKYLETTNPHQPLLTSLIESNILAGLTAHQVYVGYGSETLKYDEKSKLMDAFFERLTHDRQQQLLRTERLCYILTSPWTKAKGTAFRPEEWPDLVKVWSSTNLALYRTPYCR